MNLESLVYYIPFLFFMILLRFAFKKKNYYYRMGCEIKVVQNYLPLMIIGLYVLSAALVGMVDFKEWYPWIHESSFTIVNFMIYGMILFLYLLPALFFRPIIQYEFPKTKTITLLMFFMSLMGWFSIVYQLPYAIQGILMGAADLRHAMNTEGYYILPPSPLTTLSVGTSYFYLFYIVFFFISMIQKQNYFIRISLFVGSLSYIVSGLTFATRDVFVFYIFGFIFVYFMLYKLLSKQQNTILKRIIIVFLLLIFSGIALITLDRSSENNHSRIAPLTIGYIAQQPFVYAETVEHMTDFEGPDRYFPLFTSLYKDTLDIRKKTEVYEWNFGTFIKEFYVVGGYSFLFIMTMLIVPFFYIKLKYSKNEDFFRKIIITLFYFQFLSQGLFYFKMGTMAGNIYIVLLAFFYFLTYFKLTKRNQLIKNRIN